MKCLSNVCVCAWTSNMGRLHRFSIVLCVRRPFPCQSPRVSLAIHCVCSGCARGGSQCAQLQKAQRVCTQSSLVTKTSPNCPAKEPQSPLHPPHNPAFLCCFTSVRLSCPPPLFTKTLTGTIFGLISSVLSVLYGQPFTCANLVVWPEPIIADSVLVA